MSKVIICEQCGKSKPKYANGLCEQCYQSNYRKENKVEFEEPKSDDEIREDLKQPSKYIQRDCHLCGKQIKQQYPWCKECSIKYGLYGKSPKDWPEWAQFLKQSIDDEYHNDVKHMLHCEPLEVEETGEIKGKVNRMDYKEYVAGTNRNQLDISDLSMSQVLEKYGIDQLEYNILTIHDLKKYAKTIDIPYRTAKRMRQLLKQKMTEKMVAMVVG